MFISILYISGSHVPIIRRINCINMTSGIYIYRVSQEEETKLQESVPYVKIYNRRVFLMLKYTDITQNTYVQS